MNGNLYQWYEKYQYCKEKGIKYLHGVEVYLTETLDTKIKDNMHTILIAKNQKGFEEINRLVQLSSRKDHMYYKRRLSFEEFLNISENVIKLSGCIQSPLNKFRQKVFSEEQNNMLDRLLEHYDYYEIQYHNFEEQIEFNKYLYKMSKVYGKKLIATSDTHSLNSFKAECRTILQWGKTDGVWGDPENECDLTYKTRQELEEAFRKQNSLPMDVVLEAIDNTNVLADSVEELVFDTSDKYPYLYGKDDESVLWHTLADKYKDKVRKGIIQNDPRYLEAIKQEMKVFKKINMIGFMLFMSELLTWVRDNHIAVGYGRGSVCGSVVAYIADITDVDPIKWQTVFSRFANENRVEQADVDLDFYEDTRPMVYDYIINRFGIDKTAYVLAMGSLADLSVIDVVGKALSLQWCADRGIDYKKEGKDRLDNPYTLDKIAKIKKDYNLDKEKTIKEHQDIFYYYKGLNGCVISQGQHPAGIIVSPNDIIDFSGTFYGEDGQLITNMTMDELHLAGYIKYDILGLKTVGIIDKVYKMHGKYFPRANEVDWNDQKVFEDISNDHTGIFQFESDFAGQCLKKFGPKSVEDLCLINACIRPSGASYREEVFAHHFHKNPSALIDNILKESYGFLVYQEQTIAFLQQACSFSGSDADTIRRNIAKKLEDKIIQWLPKIIDGYCNKSDKSREVAEQEVQEFVQVIKDASGYSFGKNHSIAYSMLSYVTGYLRYYYPAEFCTAFLNCAKNDEDLVNGTKLALSKGCKIKNPKFRMSSGEYGCDAKNKIIYKGITSIKDVGKNVGDYLYSLKDNQYKDFFQFLEELDSSIVNDKSLQILIRINFFEEFGDINTLLKQKELYNNFYNRKTIKKVDTEKLGISEDLLRECGTETEKQFNNIDGKLLTNLIFNSLDIPVCDDVTKVQYQIKLLGHSDITVKSASRKYVIQEVVSNKNRTKFTVTLYEITTSEIRTVNLWGNSFKDQEFFEGDLIYIYTLKKDFKRQPSDEINPKTGKVVWKPIPGEYEFWLQSYTVLKHYDDIEKGGVNYG